ncbi:MAG TPA: hypothetical protein VI278_04135, partial [Nitrososphaeraceae archaeon]
LKSVYAISNLFRNRIFLPRFLKLDEVLKRKSLTVGNIGRSTIQYALVLLDFQKPQINMRIF